MLQKFLKKPNTLTLFIKNFDVIFSLIIEYILPHTFDAMVTLQVLVLVGYGRQESGFKSLGESFTHIYT